MYLLPSEPNQTKSIIASKGIMSDSGMSKKRSSEKDFEILRDYILACPSVPSTAPAVKAALAGLENEIKRRERDAKLQKKFAKSATLKNSADSSSSMAASAVKTQADDDEWQEIANERNSGAADTSTKSPDEEDEVEIINMEGDTSESILGKELAEAAISSMAEFQARAKTPIAAVALALHAAMCSEILGFSCTGVPDENNSAKSSGFAAPIRDLPKTQFLPRDWDKYAPGKVTLRYRKNSTGSLLLEVELVEPTSPSSNANDVCVKLVPTNTQEPPCESLCFPLGHHINLDSWNAALRAAGSIGVQPALHYVGLPSLMTNFSRAFDLGSVKEQKTCASSLVDPAIFIGVQVPRQPTHGLYKPDVFGNGDGVTDPLRVVDPRRRYDDRAPVIGTAFPQPAFAAGDFAGDLNPLGNMGLDPLQRYGPDNTGNLMGPNHPAFHGGGMTGVGGGSGFGMMPRFDPFGPPGGPQEIPSLGPDGRPARGRPGGAGNPNNDMLKPPNSLGNNNMFS